MRFPSGFSIALKFSAQAPLVNGLHPPPPALMLVRMEFIVWREEFSVGIQRIDEEHKAYAPFLKAKGVE
jgi:hypothetical protein